MLKMEVQKKRVIQIHFHYQMHHFFKKYGEPLLTRSAHMNQMKCCPAVQTGKTLITALDELTGFLQALIHINESILELSYFDHTDFINKLVKSEFFTFIKCE